MEERMPNRLIHEKSPYLLQHAHNPVDWYPWGEEAFAKAKAENKPIFLSIGYATCHWCHVMERESFEDEDVAALMRSIVVAVKVDREERPDLDTLFMSFCQAMTGQGGWPLTVILTPEGHPFFAATYLPKESSFGRTGIKDMLQRLYVAWSTNHQAVIDSAARVLAAVRTSLETQEEAGDLTGASLEAARDDLAADFDAEHGGFGGAPKFPAPHNLLFLLREWRRTKDAGCLAMVEATLLAMRAGGICDHLGLGFHRYATDERWFLPHFEKMLYDQAMLTMAYTEGYLATGREALRQTALDILEYVRRDLTSPEGLFFSAEDADSEGVEGKFYVWTAAEVRAALPSEDAALFLAAYGFEDGGNVHDEATGQATGANLPFLPVPLDRFASERGLDPAELHARLARCRATLLAIREKRVRPLRDDKVLTDWNGLMIAALAKAARAFGDAALAERARTAATVLLGAMRRDDGRLLHRLRQGQAAVPGMLDDYAFLAWGLIELYQAVFDPVFLATAVELTETMLRRFAAETGGFSLTADDAESLLVRQKVFLDAAMPCGNSVAYLVLTTLMRLTGRQEFADAALALSRAAAPTGRQRPSTLSFLLGGLSQLLTPAAEATIVGRPDAPDTRALVEAAAGSYLPELAVLLRPDGPDPAIAAVIPAIVFRKAEDGKATAHVCRGGSCQPPVTTPEAMLALLAPKRP
jgi:uncharacterized protein YyaL (SSP411 family)